MLRTKICLRLTFVMATLLVSPQCLAMENLRKKIIDAQAREKLYNTLNTILHTSFTVESLNKNMETLTKVELYLLLKNLAERINEDSHQSDYEPGPLLSLKKRAFFVYLKSRVSPKVFPSKDPSTELTPPPVPPRNDSPPIPERTILLTQALSEIIEEITAETSNTASLPPQQPEIEEIAELAAVVLQPRTPSPDA
jgi:hypothetical protein